MKKMPMKIIFTVCGALAVMGIVFCIAGTALGARREDVHQIQAVSRLENFWRTMEEKIDVFDGSQREAEPLEGDFYTFGREDVSSLDVELDVGMLQIAGTDTDEIRVETENTDNHLKCWMEGRTLKLELDGENLFFRDTEPNIYIYVPMDMGFDQVQLELGMGSMDISGVKAGQISAQVDMGQLYIYETLAENYSAFEVDAGEISVTGHQTKQLELSCDAGTINFDGIASGNVTIECDLGAILATFNQPETDFNYIMECDLGQIQIGDYEFSGMQGTKKIENTMAHSRFEASCDGGSVDVYFTE